MNSEREAAYHLGTPKENNISKIVKTLIVIAVVTVLALGSIGSVLAFSVIYKPPNFEWTEWSECTVTCGLGQQIRSRTNETATTEIDSKECRNPLCLTGEQQIDVEAQKLGHKSIATPTHFVATRWI